MSVYHFEAEDRAVVFLREIDRDTEAVLRFTLEDARALWLDLQDAIDTAGHNDRLAKEELLASLRAKVEELEEALAS